MSVATGGSPLDQLDASTRSRLRRRPHPTSVRPQLATPVDGAFSHPDWFFERKLDGMRLLVHRQDDRVRLRSRRGEDRTGGFPELVEAVADRLTRRDAVLDGEVVAFDGEATSFARLQGRMGLNDPRRARATGIEVSLHLFDLLHLDGHDLRALALRERKQLLARVIDIGGPLQLTAHHQGDGETLLSEACARGWEGLIGKDATAPYVEGRSRRWLKLPCLAGQELVIGGWTRPKGARSAFGSLLLGYHDETGLRYAGRVGTGFDEATLLGLGRRLRALELPVPPFVDPPTERGLHWVRPQLVAQVAFSEWTRDGRLRHPRFVGLRDDKDPVEVRRASPRGVAPGGAADPTGDRARRDEVVQDVGDQQVQLDGRQFSVSSLDKVMFPADGITKAQLIDHYVRLGDAILREISGRALSLKRYPEGIDGASFFQKRPGAGFPEWISRARIAREDAQDDADEYVVADQRATLAYLANQGAVELHTMTVPADRPDRPEEIILDLDPSAGAPATDAQWATRRCLELLDELGLEPRLKTTGSSGYHVHVALDGSVSQEAARTFSRDAASLLAERHPQQLTIAVRKQRRSGRVFVDWLRNSPAQTAIAAYSVRALPGAPVATPIAIEELEEVLPRQWTMASLPDRLEAGEDPWAAPRRHASDLGGARAALDEALREVRRRPS